MDAGGGFSERFKSLYPEGGLAEFARKAGIGYTTLVGYEGDALPRLDKLVLIARAANVSVHWLATGDGPRDIHSEAALSPLGTEREQELGRMIQVQSRHTAPAQADMILLPRLSIHASAGQGVIPVDEDVEEFLALKAEFLYQLGVNPRNAHVLQIKGDSMYPTFRDHDVIIVDASLVEVQEEGLYTIVYNDAVFAKRIQPLRDGSVRIASDNKSAGYIDEIVPASERHTLKIVGRIRGVYRNL